MAPVSRVTSSVATAGLVALVLLHLDFWRPQPGLLLFGWLPDELAYRIGFVLLAGLYIRFVTADRPTDGGG